MEIKNLKKVANRILRAIKNKERIILFGDADLDGIASVVILKESIENLGGKIAVIYFPDREKEGYGINKIALNLLKNQAPALFFALDLGIGNFEEVKIAKKLGFEVIIIDHHEPLNGVPQASIVVDPKQKGDKYPFKKLATCGIIFKLSKLLLNKKFSDCLKNSFLELTALATLADLMPEIEENQLFVWEGLKSLESTFRPGLRAFFEINSIAKIDSIRKIAQRIVSALNAGERRDYLNETYLLLISSSIEKAKEIACTLLEKSYQKQLRVKEIIEEIKERISKNPDQLIIFEGDSSWPLVLTGQAASKICQEYKKPVFIFKIDNKESYGGARVPEGLNCVEVMKTCASLLITYGGHPRAGGFRLKNENLKKFKECLINSLKKT